MQYITNSEKETKKLAEKIAKKHQSSRGALVIGLTGELGSGKTTFVQGFAKALGIIEKIISPTFVLIREHPIPNSPKILYHIDLYRIENTADIKQLGLKDLISNTSSIVLIERGEKIKSLLSRNTIWVSFEITNGDSRIINISSVLMI